MSFKCSLQRPAGRPGFCLLTVLLLGVTGCQRHVDDGLNKFPVSGVVLVDGAPAQGVVIRLFRDGKPGESNADSPLAVSGDEGRFRLSTNGDGDGAVPGTYRATFTWKDGNDPGAKDKLGGKYTRLEKSTIDVTIEAKKQELPPFELVSAPEAKGPAVTKARKGAGAGRPPRPAR